MTVSSLEFYIVLSFKIFKAEIKEFEAILSVDLNMLSVTA